MLDTLHVYDSPCAPVARLVLNAVFEHALILPMDYLVPSFLDSLRWKTRGQTTSGRLRDHIQIQRH